MTVITNGPATPPGVSLEWAATAVHVVKAIAHDPEIQQVLNAVMQLAPVDHLTDLSADHRAAFESIVDDVVQRLAPGMKSMSKAITLRDVVESVVSVRLKI